MGKKELGVSVHFPWESADNLRELLEKYIKNYEAQAPHAYGEEITVEIKANGYDPHWIIDLGYALDALSSAMKE